MRSQTEFGVNHQAGIFREGTSHHVFLEFAWRDRELRDLPSRLPAAALAGDVTQVVAFGARLARAVAGLPVPPQAADFETVAGADGFSAPATQQDLFVWLHGEQRDELFAAALAWRDALALLADVAQETTAFAFATAATSPASWTAPPIRRAMRASPPRSSTLATATAAAS